MAKNSVTIYDDTVLKLSIKQGTENQRIGSDTGNFTSGELAYTRDTGRVFIGDNTEKNQNNTLGGSLVGNKYLGMIDTRKSIGNNVGDELDNTPENLETFLSDNNSIYKKEYIKDDKNEDNEIKKHWNREATYNSKYDAYNGDIIYDKYQNSLILFDNRIEVTDDINNNNTSFINYTHNNENDTTVKSFHDGFVVFKNIIPDNDSLEFVPRHFNTDGTINSSDELNPYYNNNVLRIKKEYVNKLKAYSFNTDNFNISLNEDNRTLVDLNTTINVNEIKPIDDCLTLTTNNIKVGDIEFNFSNLKKGGYLYIDVNEEGIFNLSTKNTSGITSGASNSSSVRTNSITYFNKPVYLAWTNTDIINVNPITEHLNALLEYRIFDEDTQIQDENGDEIDYTYHDICCYTKYISGNTISWSDNLNPKDNKNIFFNSNFNTKTKNQYKLWNTALMVRGNNSFASLFSKENKLENINLFIKSGNTAELDAIPTDNITYITKTLNQIKDNGTLSDFGISSSEESYETYYQKLKKNKEINLYKNFIIGKDNEGYYLYLRDEIKENLNYKDDDEDFDDEDYDNENLDDVLNEALGSQEDDNFDDKNFNYSVRIIENIDDIDDTSYVKIGWLYEIGSSLRIEWLTNEKLPELNKHKTLEIPSNIPSALILKTNYNNIEKYIYYNVYSVMDDNNINVIHEYESSEYDDTFEHIDYDIGDILDQASSLILSLDRSYIPSDYSTETGIFTASNIENLKYPNYSTFSNKPILSSGFDTTNNKPIPPDFSNSNEMFIEGEGETKITSTLFEVPLYDIDGNLGFAIRLSNIMYNYNTNGYYTTLKLIGYR